MRPRHPVEVMESLRRLLRVLFAPLQPLLVVTPTERAAWVFAGLAPVALVPVAAVAIAMLTVRWTVLSALRKML